MHYLIDCHNLIAQLPDISLDDPDDEVTLVLRLRSWAAAKQKRKVTVFFDSGLPGGEDSFLSSSSVAVVFASPGFTADELLINQMRRVQNAAEYTLVSNDREVKKAAAMKKIRTISASAMANQLAIVVNPTLKENNDPESDREAELSDQELAEWLEIFTDRDQNSKSG